MKIFAIVSSLLALAAAKEGVTFTDCGNHEITLMKVTGCSHSDSVCKIHKNTAVEFEAHFTANQNTDTVALEMIAEVSGVSIPVPGLDKDGCRSHNLNCPLKKGDQEVFKYTFNLPSLIPNVKANVIAKLIGKNGPLACFKIKGQVVD